MIWARHLRLFTKVGVAAVALGALATSGNAQKHTKASSRWQLRLTGEAPHCRRAITLSLCHPTALLTDFTSRDRE